ncbi:uncharacterized protein LOC128724867 [Anopheles nili]|uniref:uncharacterized protein LOC128724867 n=1 Tax=Anopheles nili TaxID=185578 RepID=UPI00237C17F9|nr:uncharacterized protein LOC128724867 [Anopheles nili]
MNVTPLAALLDGLRGLSREMYFGEWANRKGTDFFPFHSVAQRVRFLVDEFQRNGVRGWVTPSERTEGWQQVVTFLTHLQVAGPFKDLEKKKDEKRCNWEPIGDACSNPQQPEPEQDRSSQEKARQTRRFQLTVIDILADYIRFRCESVANLRPPIQPATLLHECNRVVTCLNVIFDGNAELVTLTLLRIVPDRRYAPLLYPVFEKILMTTRENLAFIPGYVRMLLCFKRWKTLAAGRTEKARIDSQAMEMLPNRCPTIQRASDLPFLRLLPVIPPAHRVTETRYLLVNDLFQLDRCIAQYFRHHPVGGSLHGTGKDNPDDSFVRQRRLHSMEIRSNYINVPLLAELIERKSLLWAGSVPGAISPDQHLHQEVRSIVNTLRLMFRNRAEFIELTLLHVSTRPVLAPLLAPVFGAFLRPRTPSCPSSATGLAVYRSNDVATYGRLLLCYAKWKALYWDVDQTVEWARIDAAALMQLPNGFPRAICRRDALLRRIFPPADAGEASPRHTTTRILLQTLPKRADLHELCLKFIQASRCGSNATALSVQESSLNGADCLTTCSAAYKSMSSTLCGATSGKPSIPAHQSTENRSEMKPIIILDSDDADEMSTGKSPMIPARDSHVTPIPPAACVTRPLPVTGNGDTYAVMEQNRNSPCIPLDGIGAEGATPTPPLWSALVECFLNTPPATPQQDVAPEVTDEEHRRSVLVKKPPPDCSSWLRLKGTIRLIGRRKKRTPEGRPVGRVLTKVFARSGWWNYGDVLAVKIPSAPNKVAGWCSSIMKQLMGPGDVRAEHYGLEKEHVSTNDREVLLSSLPVAPMDHSKDDALLRELIDCLGAVDSMPFDSTQGYVDFAILPDNPGHGTERSHTGAEGDQASPSVYEGCIDTSPLFAADSDRYVLLFTELGPVSWPIE